MTPKKIVLFLYALSALIGCRINSENPQASLEEAVATRRPPMLPEPTGKAKKIPWGGRDPKKWRPEAIIANAASWLMNEGWLLPGTVDVTVAVPGKFKIGWRNPYDDGQSNAMMHFGEWTHYTPPMIAALVKKSNGTQTLLLWIARQYKDAPQYIEITNTNRKVAFKTIKLATKMTPAGDAVVKWDNIPDSLEWGSLTQENPVFVRPGPNFKDWLPLYFRMPVYPAKTLVEKLPASQRSYADGARLLDRENLRQTSASDKTPFEKALNHSFKSHYNFGNEGAPYIPEYIHGQFSGESKRPITAVGKGWTWVAEKDRPFKILYTCFDRRHPEGSKTRGTTEQLYNEATAPDGGVVSGGGWHVIGEVNRSRPEWFASETIINDLEHAPIMVAGGFEDPASRKNLRPPSNNIAFGLSDLATLRWLWPNEAFVTVSSAKQKNYHWFFFDFDREVCTEEWVYSCDEASRHNIQELMCEGT